MRKILLALFLGFAVYASYLATLDEADLPPLHDGDLIFQTSWTEQTLAIALGSGSWYIHTGILKHTDHGWVVVHAARHVEEWPLAQWIDGGILRRFAVYRYRGLAPQQASRMLEAAKQYYGRPYDFYFSFDNKEIYCSELEYLAFKDAGIPLGTPDRIGTLHINNAFSRKLIEQRWREYPKCASKDMTFDQCYDILMAQELITPIGIARDPHLELIFSNYP